MSSASIRARNSPRAWSISSVIVATRPRVARLDGGVWLNLGSAVVMPEVFLKAVAVARNLGYALDGMTTANLDFQQQYRGRLNVLDRPGGEGIALTGHHELLIPLLHAMVLARISPASERLP